MPLMRKSWQPAWRTAHGVALLVPVALWLTAFGARAADEPAPAQEVFRDNTQDVVQAAATLAGSGGQGGPGATLILGQLLQGEQLHLWKLEASDKALPL